MFFGNFEGSGEITEQLSKQIFTHFLERFEVLETAPKPFEPETLATWAGDYSTDSSQANIARFLIWLRGCEHHQTQEMQVPEDFPSFVGSRDVVLRVSPFKLGIFQWNKAMETLSVKELSTCFDIMMMIKTAEIQVLDMSDLFPHAVGEA